MILNIINHVKLAKNRTSQVFLKRKLLISLSFDNPNLIKTKIFSTYTLKS